jgi:hypothetical protein
MQGKKRAKIDPRGFKSDQVQIAIFRKNILGDAKK